MFYGLIIIIKYWILLFVCVGPLKCGDCVRPNMLKNEHALICLCLDCSAEFEPYLFWIEASWPIRFCECLSLTPSNSHHIGAIKVLGCAQISCCVFQTVSDMACDCLSSRPNVFRFNQYTFNLIRSQRLKTANANYCYNRCANEMLSATVLH